MDISSQLFGSLATVDLDEIGVYLLWCLFLLLCPVSWLHFQEPTVLGERWNLFLHKMSPWCLNYVRAGCICRIHMFVQVEV